MARAPETVRMMVRRPGVIGRIGKDFVVDPHRKLAEEETFYVAVSGAPKCAISRHAATERFQIHAKTPAAAIRRVLRRAHFNDDRLVVAAVEIEDVLDPTLRKPS